MLSLHVCVFVREHMFAHVPGLSCVLCVSVLPADSGCRHLEGNIYAFGFNTLLVLSLYSVRGTGPF